MGAITKVGAAIAISVAVLVTSALPAAGRPANPFVGSWENTDAFDGSHQHLSIGGGPGHFRYRDAGASACLNAELGFVPASLSGSGEWDGSTFAFTADLYCHTRGRGGRQLLFPVSLTFTYDTATDTLSDSGGQGCWYRSGSPEACD